MRNICLALAAFLMFCGLFSGFVETVEAADQQTSAAELKMPSDIGVGQDWVTGFNMETAKAADSNVIWKNAENSIQQTSAANHKITDISANQTWLTGINDDDENESGGCGSGIGGLAISFIGVTPFTHRKRNN